MKIDIILAGVGGQGIVSIAAVIGMAAIDSGLFIKQSEVHGMSVRGGEVESNLRICDKPIASDLISEGKADMIISVEPMEALRYINMLKCGGWIITNTKPFVNVPNYPDIEKILATIKKFPNQIALDADKIAEELGSAKSTNMVILGAASPYLGIEYSKLENAIKNLFKKKGSSIINANISALEAGKKFADNYILVK